MQLRYFSHEYRLTVTDLIQVIMNRLNTVFTVIEKKKQLLKTYAYDNKQRLYTLNLFCPNSRSPNVTSSLKRRQRKDTPILFGIFMMNYGSKIPQSCKDSDFCCYCINAIGNELHYFCICYINKLLPP